MKTSQPGRTKFVFIEALERSGPDRADFLDHACADTPDLRGRVEALLADAEIDDRFLGDATLESRVFPAPPPPEHVGALIGPYRIHGIIGEGGFGVVYVADQEAPLRRRVALKIIKPGMDTRAVIARFEQERQALAVMDHPNIARVLDAGSTGAGRPYFVMELVRGVPITDYCDQNRLTINKRLALFTQVCQGIQHAHSKGVIHRDIKPSNVLVSTEDTGPLARIIDFGVAKATTQRPGDIVAVTGEGRFIGTPEYMSPEQAKGSLDVDTRTDVYSLGVLLYQLLAGVTPFDPQRIRAAPYAELQRIIREVDPPRPSTRLSELADALPGVAARRLVDPCALPRLLRGDLDWIVMRAMEKDRARRYETANALAADIQRYLAGEPVAAAPPATGYRLRKFVRRHRVPVLAASLVGGALLLGVIGTTIGLVHALAQRDKAVAAELLADIRLAAAERARADADAAREQADKSRRIASAVTQFFTQDVLDITPRPAGAPEPTVRELLDAVPAKIDSYFTSDPAIEGVIRERVGQLYRRLGDVERSRQYLEDAIPLLENGLGPDHKMTLSAVQRSGELNLDAGSFDVAAGLFDKAYQGRLRAYGLAYPMTMSSLRRRGYARVCAGRIDEGFRDLTDALEYCRKTGGPESRAAILCQLDLCDACLHLSRAEEARTLARRSLEAVLARQGALAGLEWGARIRLGSACRMLGQLDEAMTQFDKVLDIAGQIYPPTHPEFIQIRLERGRALAALGWVETARAELESAYSVAESTFGAHSCACCEIAESLAALAEREVDLEAAARWRACMQ